MAGVIQRDCLDLTRLLQSGACLFRILSKNDFLSCLLSCLVFLLYLSFLVRFVLKVLSILVSLLLCRPTFLVSFITSAGK